MRYLAPFFLFWLVAILVCPFHVLADINNKFGIHIAVPHDEDLVKARDLVNSNGGDYGYVTLVIQEDNRDVVYWQQVFDKLREYRLIPIVRLATRPEGEAWRAPTTQDVVSWVDFLQNLNWVIRERYIILFNEPNHAKEWGGVVDASAYGRVAGELALGLHYANPDYRVMLAGLDLSSPNQPPKYADAFSFLAEAKEAFCEVVKSQSLPCGDLLHAISSHSYPNPGFVGSPLDTGRRSVRGYETEIGWFKKLFGKEYPVYITETGWNAYILGQQVVANNYETAFRRVWLPDDRVKAVTPFILNYQSEPFLQFSFLQRGNTQPQPKYTAVQNLPKVAGKPDIVDTASIQAQLPSGELVTQSSYKAAVFVRNTGQAMWQPWDFYALNLRSRTGRSIVELAQPVRIHGLKPKEEVKIDVQIVTSAQGGEDIVDFVIQKEELPIAESAPQRVSVVQPPKLNVRASLLMKGFSTGDDFELQIFDREERLVYKHPQFKLTLGRGVVEQVSSIVVGYEYRIVLLKPYYLPRQLRTKLVAGENTLIFEPLIPLDFNRDGRFSVGDVKGLFTRNQEEDMGTIEKIYLLLP